VGLAFVDAAGTPQYASVPSSPPTSPGFANGLVSWSPDGRQLAIVDQNTNANAMIWVVEPDALQPQHRKVTELSGGGRIRGMTWAPDGSAIIVGTHETAGDIVVMHQDP
jgi:Tol biopolymer transport system component